MAASARSHTALSPMKFSGRVARKALTSEKPKSFRMSQAEPHAGGHLLFDLVFAKEQVGIVLGEAAHAEQPMQHARTFIAVDRAQLGVTDGQLAVRAHLRPIDRDVETGNSMGPHQIALALPVPCRRRDSLCSARGGRISPAAAREPREA